MVLEHACGHRLAANVVCEACGEPAEARTVRPTAMTKQLTQAARVVVVNEAWVVQPSFGPVTRCDDLGTTVPLAVSQPRAER